MNKYIQVSLLFWTLMIASCATQKQIVFKPKVFEFGSTMVEMQHRMQPLSDSLSVRLNEEIQLPTAHKSQSQLDVHGFMYAGKKRKAELIFADDALDIVWILTEAEEEEKFIEKFESMYGAPTHITNEATFFINDATAVRNTPHEVLFISQRLIEPYKQFLGSMK
ncbi:MAG: hypothetical protein P1U56_23830 [Saprospiraceae bacterium]|nr:hypothetical protein [Saprospiraceae bacterium]